jgi:hypothetical protein
MRQASIAEMIRRGLRDQYDAVLTEPLPTRWVDLINRLGQQEGQAPQTKADPDQRAIAAPATAREGKGEGARLIRPL